MDHKYQPELIIINRNKDIHSITRHQDETLQIVTSLNDRSALLYTSAHALTIPAQIWISGSEQDRWSLLSIQMKYVGSLIYSGLGYLRFIGTRKSRCKTLIVLSSEPLSRYWPSGLNATVRTAPPCALITLDLASLRLNKFQKLLSCLTLILLLAT